MKLYHWQKFKKTQMDVFLPQGVEIKIIFGLRAAVFEIRADFQNFHIWAFGI